MNILSTNCLGAFIYRDVLNIPYNNPFIWTTFSFKDFKTLITDYEKINFKNVELFKEGNEFSNNFNLRIDDKITLKNTHIFFDKNQSTLLKKNNCVFYNKPWEYIIEKYNNRITRMDNNVIIMIYDSTLSQKEISDLYSICKAKNYPTLFFTKYDISETDKIKKIPFETYNGDWIKPLLLKHKNDIKKFLNIFY